MTERLLTASEFARATGLTVRALHFYEQHGLVKPRRQSGNRYRLYGAAELGRVQEIVVLKQLGLTLAEIKRLVTTRPLDLAELLTLQRRLMAERQAEAAKALAGLDAALAVARSGRALDIDTLCDLIRMTDVTKTPAEWQAVHRQYFSEEQLQSLAARPIAEAERQGYEAEWAKIIATAKALVGTDPAAPAAQAIAQRSQELIDLFTGGDPSISASLNAMYADRDKWMASAGPGFEPAVVAFLAKARAALQRG